MSLSLETPISPWGVERPIVHLPTSTVIGWTIERHRSSSIDWLDRLSTKITNSASLDGPAMLHIVPWSAATGRWLQRQRPSGGGTNTGVMIELPARSDHAEFDRALSVVSQSGLRACLSFDGDVAIVAELHQRGLLGAVRIKTIRAMLDGTPALGTRLGRQMIRSLDDAGITVIVDGVADRDTAVRLRRAGIRFAQGTAFEGGAPARDTNHLLTLDRPQPDPDEADRLAMVRAADVLDSAPDHTFDVVVRLVTERCKSVIAAISIIDVDRQWFHASVGLDVNETPRRYAFCDHTIRHMGPYIVTDALNEPAFADNPLVTGPPYIRAYLGVPLRAANGLAFGALCAIDTQPRTFQPDEITEITALARLVTSDLELRARSNRNGADQRSSSASPAQRDDDRTPR